MELKLQKACQSHNLHECSTREASCLFLLLHCDLWPSETSGRGRALLRDQFWVPFLVLVLGHPSLPQHSHPSLMSSQDVQTCNTFLLGSSSCYLLIKEMNQPDCSAVFYPFYTSRQRLPSCNICLTNSSAAGRGDIAPGPGDFSACPKEEHVLH